VEKFIEDDCTVRRNSKYEYSEYERGMLTSESVLFKIRRLFFVILKQSLSLPLLLANFIFCLLFLRIKFRYKKNLSGTF
jgi:hypothetical protein